MNDRLKEIRAHTGMTQADFAKALGIGQSTLAMMEVGKRDILDRHIKTICAIFGVDEHWLRTGEGEMFCEKPSPAGMLLPLKLEDRIKWVRQQMGMTQREFANLLNISKSTLEEYEYGNCRPAPAVIELIAIKCGVRQEWIVSGEGKPFSPQSVDNVVQFNRTHSDMTDVDKALMEAFFSLADDQKDAFLRYCLSVAEAWHAQERKKSAVAARSGDRAEVNQVSKEEEDAVLPPKYTGDM